MLGLKLSCLKVIIIGIDDKNVHKLVDHIEYTNKLPTGDDVCTIMNTLYLLNQGEVHIVKTFAKSMRDRSGKIKTDSIIRDIEWPLTNIDPKLFWFPFNYENTLNKTKEILLDLEYGVMHYQSSYSFWCPSNFMVLAYMGTNIELPVPNKRKKMYKRKPVDDSDGFTTLLEFKNDDSWVEKILNSLQSTILDHIT